MNKVRLELSEAMAEAVAKSRHAQRASLACQGRGERLKAIELPLTCPQLGIIKVEKGISLSLIRKGLPGGAGLTGTILADRVKQLFVSCSDIHPELIMLVVNVPKALINESLLVRSFYAT